MMQRDFRWPVDIDLWVPLGLADDQFTEDNRFNESFGAMARLKPGVPFASANALVGVLSDRVKSNGTRGGAFAKDASWGMFLLPFTDFVAGDTRTSDACATRRGGLRPDHRLREHRRLDARPRLRTDPRDRHPRGLGRGTMEPHSPIVL
ncbi:MAG: hypothetical protein WDO73_24835 [Ignavibacteriota bacterium]